MKTIDVIAALFVITAVFIISFLVTRNRALERVYSDLTDDYITARGDFIDVEFRLNILKSMLSETCGLDICIDGSPVRCFGVQLRNITTDESRPDCVVLREKCETLPVFNTTPTDHYFFDSCVWIEDEKTCECMI